MAKKAVKNRKAVKKKKLFRKKPVKKFSSKKKSSAKKASPARKAAKRPVKKPDNKKRPKSSAKKTAKGSVVRRTAGKSPKKPAKGAMPAGRHGSASGRKSPVRKKAVTRSKKPHKKPARKSTSKLAQKKRTKVRGPRRARLTKAFIRIKVVGIGGGGGNAITRMRKGFSVRGVEFIAINTDVQDLESCDAHRKLNIGRALTKGMGSGMNPELGQQAAEENRSEISEILKDTDMVFLTAGFGGGTGTGALPVIADIARELGILTVAVITKPFSFEGTARAKIAEDGMARIKDRVDTLLVIPNDRIFTIIDKNTSVLKAFEKIDDILRSAVQGVSEIISGSGLINVDFADIRAVTAGAGMAVIGVGTAGGADRAVKAINQAIHSPLLDISIDGARNVLFGIAGGRDMRMSEINEAAKIIADAVDPGAKIIFGAYHDRRLKTGTIKITLIATGFNGMLFKSESDSLTLFADDAEPFAEVPEITDKSIKSDAMEGTSQKDEGAEEESVEDILDTPTFLRKKGRRR